MTPDLWIEGLNGKVRIMDPPVRELLEFHDKPYQNFVRILIFQVRIREYKHCIQIVVMKL